MTPNEAGSVDIASTNSQRAESGATVKGEGSAGGLVMSADQNSSKPWIMPEEHLSLLEELRARSVGFVPLTISPKEDTVCSLFAVQAAKRPEHLAVVGHTSSLTYSQLDSFSDGIAATLSDDLTNPQPTVALFLDHDAQLITSILGVLKAGKAYIPLDPHFTGTRNRVIIEDSSTKCVLTDDKYFETARALFSADTRILNVNQIAFGHGYSGGVVPQQSACIIYTSGSTGRPRGVLHSHLGFLQLVKRFINAFAIGPRDRLTLLPSCTVNASIGNIFSALLTGATLFPFNVRERGHSKLIDWMISNEITFYNSVPSLFRAAFQNLAPGKIVPRLRLVRVGADMAYKSDFDLFRAHVDEKCMMVNSYGCSEFGSACCFYLKPDSSVTESILPVGYPIEDTQIVILEDDERSGNSNHAGEIGIISNCIANYYSDQQRSGSDTDAPRLYRTGDYGVISGGYLIHRGRRDSQVKVRGFRIELLEIESNVLSHPSVKHATVVAKDVKGHEHEKVLAAYVVRHPGSSLDEDELTAHLAANLPSHMLPRIVFVDALPETGAGKVDRGALMKLPLPEAQNTEYIAPRSREERMVASIWADVLKIDRVGRHDDFFSLGGHSLLASSVITRIQQAMGVEVTISDLFAQPVLSDLARSLENAAAVALVPIAPAQRDKLLPLSFAQQRLWFLAQIEGLSEAYHIFRGLRLTGSLDVAALRGALDGIVRRHESLRTRFEIMDEAPVQWIRPAEESQFHLIEHDLRGSSDAQGELDRITDLEAGQQFDLRAGPLIRGRLIRLQEDEHVLLLTMHHIVSDGWSMGVLVNELSALYGALVRGEGSCLPELGIQYADYTVWQRERIQGALLEEQGNYWKQALSGAPALLEIPADRARPAEQSFAGSFVELELDETLTAGLQALSRRHGVTLYMTLLAGWSALLARLSGQEDIVVGSPVANRGRAEIENLIGFFVNTLAMRLEVNGALTVRELLEQTKTKALAAQQNQDIPFEQVVELTRPARSLAYSPLFQVLFVWQNTTQARYDLPGLQVERLRTPHKVAKFDLLLDLREVGDKIAGFVEYSTALFDRTTIERYAGYFKTLLRAMAEDDGQMIDRLPILSEPERQRVLYEWNETKADYASDKCVHELFEEQASRNPNAVAVIFEDQKLSYAELNREANRLAHYLRGLGVGPDARVAICVERSLEMIVALMAVLKAGGAYVPLDPAYPVERLGFMLEDSEPVVLLTQQRLAEQFAGIGGKIPLLDLGKTSIWQRQPETNPRAAESGLTPRNLAYIIYTSGSTGMPKGVAMPHKAVANLLFWQISKSDPTLQRRTLQFAALGFDVSFQETCSTLCSGGTLVLITEDKRLDPISLFGFIRANGIQRLFLPYTVLRLFAEGVENTRNGYQDNACLDCMLQEIITAGEQLCVEPNILRLFEQLNDCRLENQYGPTETHVASSLELPSDMSRWPNFPPIGRPISNARMYVLDKCREPVPIGVAGELYIGGAGVARGYLNRPELTAERFLKDPFVDEPEARMYRTGDLGRWLPDGNIEFLGRNDFQVKIRGFRIELGEIEARLMEHPAVREAVVLAREDSPGDKRLAAYYTAAAADREQAEAGVSAEDLRSYLSAVLPEYMVPAAYVRLERLPLTPNGKLDRRALPAPEQDAYSVRGYEPPEGEIETALAAIWADVLKLDKVGRHDDFFDLGGHSLLAVRLMMRLQTMTGGEMLPLRAILEAPTVERFAAWLRKHEGNEQRLMVCLRQGSDARTPFFCVHASDGTAVGMRQLAMGMDADLPFYCLQAKGLDGSEPFESIEEAARCYLEEIRKVQPNGPYHLGGYCLGGVIAFEMARMLEQQGEIVDPLILIDSRNPSFLRLEKTGETLARLALFYKRRVAGHARNMRSLSPAAWLGYATGRVKAMYVHAQRSRKKVAKAKDNQLPANANTGEARPSPTENLEKLVRDLRWVGPAMLRKYVPMPYSGGAVVFRVTEHKDDALEDFYLGWKKVIHGPMESYEIEAMHATILSNPASVQMLAEQINVKLREPVAQR